MANRLMNPKILKLSRFGQIICWLGIAGMLALPAWLALNPDQVAALVQSQIPAELKMTPATPSTVAGAALIFALPFALILAAFWQAAQLFSTIRQGAFLSEKFYGLLISIGWLALATAVVNILARTIGIYILSLANPPGQRLLSFGLSSNEISACIAGILLLVFALLQKEMAAIDEENKSIL